jgi:hypothetical protein
MSGHTPGPWFSRIGYVETSDAAGRSVIVDCGHQGNLDLISAAPELLEFAKRYLASNDECVVDGETSPLCECVVCSLTQAAQAAIAKAEGRS